MFIISLYLILTADETKIQMLPRTALVDFPCRCCYTAVSLMDRVKRIHVDCLLGWELFEMVKEEEQKVYKG